MPEWLLLSVLKWKTLNVVKKRLLFVLSLDVNPLTIIKSFWTFVVAFSWFFHPMPCNWFLWTRCWWKRCNFWMLFKVKREKKRVEVWKQEGGGGRKKWVLLYLKVGIWTVSSAEATQRLLSDWLPSDNNVQVPSIARGYFSDGIAACSLAFQQRFPLPFQTTNFLLLFLRARRSLCCRPPSHIITWKSC